MRGRHCPVTTYRIQLKLHKVEIFDCGRTPAKWCRPKLIAKREKERERKKKNPCRKFGEGGWNRPFRTSFFLFSICLIAGLDPCKVAHLAGGFLHFWRASTFTPYKAQSSCSSLWFGAGYSQTAAVPTHWYYTLTHTHTQKPLTISAVISRLNHGLLTHIKQTVHIHALHRNGVETTTFKNMFRSNDQCHLLTPKIKEQHILLSG